MRLVLVLILLLFVVSFSPPIFWTDEEMTIQHLPAQDDSNIERNWTLNIILVNYDSEIINETVLLEAMPTQRTHYTTQTLIVYNIEYNIYHADEYYADLLYQVAIGSSIEGSDIGTALNETELELQVGDPNTPRQVFHERAGRSIDGFIIEDWLIENPFVPAPALGYNFYLLNFSEFDSPDHTIEHWFDYHPIDPDTGVSQTWFRLEFDNDLNPPLMMQYAGIGGRGNIYALDPSADQWYLRWARIWWQDEISIEYDHWTKDLEDITALVDLNSDSGKRFLNEYLRNYMFDVVSCVLFPTFHSPAKYVTSGEVKLAIVCVNELGGIHSGSLNWITDTTWFKMQLQDLYPFLDWNVEVQFIDTDENQFWNNTFWNYANVSEDGITEVAGGALLNHIYEIVRPYQITTSPDNINVFGVVFIKSNMLMYADSGTYTGLGYFGPDGGQTLVCKSLERYYQDDNVTPREGVSSLQLHEIMHAIGFSHTWQQEHYAGDFSFSPMGYFAMHNGTSSFEKDWVQGTYLDQMESDLFADFLFKQGYLEPTDPEKTFIAEQNAIDAFHRAQSNYNKMNWVEAYEDLCKARDWTKRMIYSRTDDTPPAIDACGTVPSEIGFEDFEYWVYTTDRSGIENVTLHVQIDHGVILQYICIYDNPNWTTSVPSNFYQNNLTLWVVVWDWGMNRAEGGRISSIVRNNSFIGEFILPLIISIGACSTVIYVAFFLAKRYR